MSDDYDLLKSNPLIASALSDTPTSTTTGGPSLGWADGIGEGQSSKDLLNRGDVLADLRAFYKERDGFEPSNDEELRDKFWSDRTWRNVNTVSMGKDVKDVYSMSDEQATRLARIQKLHDSLPDFYEKGGRGLSGFAQNAGAAIIDPVNLLGGIFGKAAGGSAMRVSAKAALNEAGRRGMKRVLTNEMRGQIVRRGVLAGAKAGAKVEALESAVTGMGQDALIQARNSELGLQDGYSVTQGLGSAVTNAVIGGSVGSVFGAAGALYGGKISRAVKKANNNVFGEFTNRYTSPESVVSPDGVAGTVETEAAGTLATPSEKSDAKVEKYIAAQRDQYQRNLNATVDLVRGESGDKAFAEWRSGAIKDADKTETMKQAEAMQNGRTALEELYTWPAKRQAHTRQLEQLSRIETLKPEQVTQLSALNDIIARGDDAYEAIIRAAGDGKEADFDKALDVFADATKRATDKDKAPAVQQPQQVQAPAVKVDETNTIVANIEDVASADETALSSELSAVTTAKQQGITIPTGYEQLLQARFKEITGKDFVNKAPDVDTTVIEAPAAAPALPQISTAAEAQDAISKMGKQYNALTNQIARINKAIASGKAKPEQQARLKEVTSQREALNTQRKQLEERAASLAAQEASNPTPAIERTIEAEVADSPLDVEGAATYLSTFGFPVANVKKEMATYIATAAPKTREARAEVAREYIANRITYARSLAHLEKAFDSYGVNVAYMPDVMEKLLATSELPADLRPAVLSRYSEWLDSNAMVLFTKYIADNPELQTNDVLSLLEQNHGESMALRVLEQLGSPDDSNDIIQHMAYKKGMPLGWDKLTAPQQNAITQKIEGIRARLTGPGATALSPKKLEGLLELQKRQLIIKQLEDDFGAAVRTSGQSLGDSYPVIIDPETKGNVSGKVWNYAGNGTATVGSDKYGLQAMLKKATGGRATNVDEYGDLVIENPYFGSLLVRTIERNPDGSINYAKTTAGKRYAKKFDAAESAKRAIEEAQIARASNRKAKVGEDVANLKAGDEATAKELAAAQVEAARSNPNRKALNQKTTGPAKDEAAEALSKQLRESVKKTVVADAVRNAIETSPSAPERVLQQNITQVEAELGQPVSLAEAEAAWGAVEAETRSMSVEQVRSKRIAEAQQNFLIHNDIDTLVADLKRINSEMSQTNTKPRAHADKPVGAKVEPRMYVYRGYEVDVRNQFSYKKTSDSTTSISFMGEKVGDLKTSSDGSATLLYTDADGLEASVKASSLDQMAAHLPRIFGSKVEAAGAAGKLTKSFDESTDKVYPIDWKASNTWGKQSKTVPVETIVDEPAAVIGPVSDFKKNGDVSSINLDIPEGHVLAVHILEGDFQGVTRVESTKSKSPQTVSAILGNQKTKAYTVGYVPAGTQSASRDATRLFKQLDSNDAVYRAGAPEAGSAKGKSPAIEQDELGQVSLDGLSKIAIDQNDLPVQFRDKGLTTLAKIHNLITSLENIRWADIKTAAQYATFTKDINELYEARKKYAPDGVKLPTAARAIAMNQWQKAMSNYDGTTIATGIDILRRLSANDRDLPIISTKDMGSDAGGYALPAAGSENANRIFLNPSAFDPDGKGTQVPQPIALLHEVAHWAYMNVLDDADRMQFWGSLGKYFNGSELDLNQIRSRLPGVTPEEEALSPAEFFANQFVQAAITEGKVNNIPLWSKMARVLVQIMNAFGVNVRGDRVFADQNLVDIDPDFAKLFAKILPENDRMYDRYVGLYKTLEDAKQLKSDKHAKTASLAAKQLVDFDDMRRKLDSAIDTQNPMDLELALNEVASDIYSKFGGKYSKVRLLKGGSASTSKARRELLTAHAKWKEIQRELYSEGNTPRELSTADLADSESGDLASGFEAMTDVAFSTLDSDLTSSLSLTANNFINAIVTAQDEMRAIIGRTGQLEGKNIRVSKDGSTRTIAANNHGLVQRKRAARRAYGKTMAAAKEIDQIVNDIENGIAPTNDRDHLPQPTITETAAMTPVNLMSTDALAVEYKSLAGQRTVRKKEIEAEIKGRASSAPEIELKVPDVKYQDIPLKALEKDLLSAIKRGKWDDMRAIASAIGFKKRANLEEGILTATSPKVRKAAAILQDSHSASTTDNGVPANAPIQVRDTIKNITHRTRTDEATARITATRLLALVGRGMSGSNEDGFVTRNDISRLLGQGDIGDEAPLAETDQLFSMFRDDMREIAKDMRTPAGKITAAQKLSRMSINALTSEEELAKIGTTADELSAAFISVARQQGSIDSIFDEYPEAARARIADIYKENTQALGMLMRGMLDSATRKELQPLTYYGDMLREPVERRIFRSAVDNTGFRGVHPALATSYRKEIINNTKPLRRSTIESYSGRPLEESILFFDGNGSVPFELLESKGKLSAPVTEGDFGTGVYLRSAPMESDAPNENIKWASKTIQELRDRISREQANIEAMRNAGEDVADYTATVLNPLFRRLSTATTTEANLWRELRKTDGLVGQNKAVPFVSRARNSFDFSDSTEYTFGTESASSLDWLLTSLEDAGLVASKDADQLRGSPTTFTGKEIYAQLRRAVARSADVSTSDSANTLNEGLKQIGFDSINFGDGHMLFDADSVRHIDDAAFSLDDQVSTFLDGNNTSVAGQYLEAMMNGDVDSKNGTPLVTELQKMAFPAAMADPVKRVFQKKNVSVADIENVGFWTRLLGESSVRIRKSGAHWLADKIKPQGGSGFYEKQDAMLGKALLVSRDEKGRPISLISKMRKLPGAPSIGKRWAERNKFWGKVPQPPVYDAIVMALRMGDAAINKLPKEAREVARDIQKFHREQFVAARADGLPIGFKADYGLAQVYDADAIKVDPQGFEELLTQFFLREMKQGRVPMPSVKDPLLVAREKATRLRRTLTSEGSDGVLLPDANLRQSMESPFFERVMNYQPHEIPGISKYLVNDLEGILTRYADQVSRRRIMTREFGLGNHAVSTYLNILQNGKDAIVDALRNSKTMTTERRAADATMDTRVGETDEIIRAIPGTEEEVSAQVDTAISLLGTSPAQWRANKEKVRNYLLNLQDPQVVATQPEFLKRIDAITNALVEYGGKPDMIAGHEIKAMVDTVNAASKKARDVSPHMLKASRAIRGFQQITLLPWTTLTSIPDLGLPAVRSGNLKAAAAAWKGFLSDPHYREMGRNIALGVQGIMHERMAHMYNDTSGRMSNAFFNLNLLTPWTDTMRPVAALVGLESFKAEAKRAQDLAAKGMTDSRGYKTSLRYLSRYGLEAYALPGSKAISEDTVDIATDDTLREAMLRFANEAIFAPNPNDIPLWAQHPVGQLVFQLKSYPLMMGRMAKYVAKEAVKFDENGKYIGNPKPFMMLLASGGALGSLSLASKDVIMQRGEGENTFRERYGSEQAMTGAFIRWYNAVAEDMGLDIEQQGTADAVIGWFTESFMSAGGMGLFADLLHSSVEQADNQDYGTMRTVGAFLGPTSSSVYDAARIIQATSGQVFSEEPDARTTRSAIRSVVGRVPFVGSIKPVKEGIVDTLVEPSSPNKSTKTTGVKII